MILYNVTIGIDKDIEQEWLSWMKETHVPRVMNTGKFLDSKIFKVIGQEEGEQSVSYSFQYFAKSINEVVDYLDNHAGPIVEDHNRRYVNRHVAFRTLLEEA